MTNTAVSHLLLLYPDSVIGVFTLLIFCGDKGKTCRKFEGRKVEKDLILIICPVQINNDTGKGGHWLLDLLSQMVDELETQFIEGNCIITWSHKRDSDIFKNTFS